MSKKDSKPKNESGKAQSAPRKSDTRATHPDDLILQIEKMKAILQGEDELQCAILGASFLDHCLGSLLQEFFVESDITTQLLKPGRALGDLSARNRTAYVSGLIPKTLFQNIERIATIRNGFAHKLFAASFADEEIIALCKELTQMPLFGLNSYSAKDRFCAAVISAINEVLLVATTVTRMAQKPEPNYHTFAIGVVRATS